VGGAAVVPRSCPTRRRGCPHRSGTKQFGENARVPAYLLNEYAVRHAQRLIDARQYVLRSRWQNVQPRCTRAERVPEDPLLGGVRRLASRPDRGRGRGDEGALRVRVRRFPSSAPDGADRLPLRCRGVAPQRDRARRTRIAPVPRPKERLTTRRRRASAPPPSRLSARSTRGSASGVGQAPRASRAARRARTLPLVEERAVCFPATKGQAKGPPLACRSPRRFSQREGDNAARLPFGARRAPLPGSAISKSTTPRRGRSRRLGVGRCRWETAAATATS
jgi:hypothetical protein